MKRISTIFLFGVLSVLNIICFRTNNSQVTDCEFRNEVTINREENNPIFIDLFLPPTDRFSLTYFLRMSEQQYSKDVLDIEILLKGCRDKFNRETNCVGHYGILSTVGWMKLNITFKEGPENKIDDRTGANFSLIVQPKLTKARFKISPEVVGFVNCLSDIKKYHISQGKSMIIPLTFWKGISQLEFKSDFEKSYPILRINSVLYFTCVSEEHKVRLLNMEDATFKSCFLPISRNFYNLRLNSSLFTGIIWNADDRTDVSMIKIEAFANYGGIFVRASSRIYEINDKIPSINWSGAALITVIVILLLIIFFLTVLLYSICKKMENAEKVRRNVNEDTVIATNPPPINENTEDNLYTDFYENTVPSKKNSGTSDNEDGDDNSFTIYNEVYGSAS